MFRNKKGDMPTLEEIVKFIPHLLLAIVLLFVIMNFYRSCVAETRTPQDVDFDRVIAEMKDLSNGESITVPISGKDYSMIVSEKNTSQSHWHCTEQTCICLYKTSTSVSSDTPSRCEIFRDGGKIVGGNCIDGKICLQMTDSKITTQTKINLYKNNNVVVISPKK